MVIRAANCEAGQSFQQSVSIGPPGGMFAQEGGNHQEVLQIERLPRRVQCTWARLCTDQHCSNRGEVKGVRS